MLKIWRITHLALAIVSFLFIVMASITGAILSIEPIQEKNLPYKTADFDTITVAHSLSKLKEIHPELLEISVDNHQFVTIKGFDEEENDFTKIANPLTGEFLANPIEKSEFMQWITHLHRSLFLHETGRFIVGIFSILLVLIALSGTALLVKRSTGFRGLYDKIKTDFWEQFYHILAGRLTLIPILIISITGSYLFLQRFEYLPEEKEFDFVEYSSNEKQRLPLKDYPAFKNLYLADIEKIELPFDDSADEVFKVKTKTSQFTVNQIDGTFISESQYSKWTILGKWSFDLHTGQINSIWSLIIGIASLQLLFFIYSGFVITYKRTKNKQKDNPFSIAEATSLLLVGSENGSSWIFAKNFQNQANSIGKKVFIQEANHFQLGNSIEEILIFTSTYGKGDAPSNANLLINKLKNTQTSKEIRFSVVGFGSTQYENFCSFAKEVNHELQKLNWAKESIPIHYINDKNPLEFAQWVEKYNIENQSTIATTPALFNCESTKKQSFLVKNNIQVQSEDHLFSIELQTKANFQSGDLLAIYPSDNHIQRLYSVSKIDNKLFLLVKLHEKGLGSNYLYNLKTNQQFEAKIIDNQKFHFPKNKSVICISNGTGIAPFLGMIYENNYKQPMYLYAGFQQPTDFIQNIKQGLEQQISKGKLTKLQFAYSRIEDKQYVIHLIKNDQNELAELLKNGAVVMVCGSLSMWKNVQEELEIIAQINGYSLEYYIENQQIKTDCY